MMYDVSIISKMSILLPWLLYLTIKPLNQVMYVLKLCSFFTLLWSLNLLNFHTYYQFDNFYNKFWYFDCGCIEPVDQFWEKWLLNRVSPKPWMWLIYPIYLVFFWFFLRIFVVFGVEVSHIFVKCIDYCK